MRLRAYYISMSSTPNLFRDPMSKTLAIASVGISSLTLLGLTITVGSIIKGNIGDGAIIGLLATVVGGITGCVTAVASRAAPPGKELPTKSSPNE